MLNSKTFLFIVLLIGGIFSLQAQQSGIQALQVKFLYDDLRFEDAIQYGETLLRSGTQLTQKELILIHQYMAFSFFNLGERDSARVHFLTLLSLQPDLKLDPVSTSPKIIEFFEAVRQEYQQLAQEKRLVPIKQYIFLKDRRPDAAWRSALLPGWGQFYKRQKKRGYVLGGLFFGSAAFTLTAYALESKYHRDYLNETEMANIPALYDRYNRWWKTRRTLTVVTALFWAVSFTDALWSNYPRLQLESAPNQGMALSFRFSF